MTIDGDFLGQGWRYPVTSGPDGPRWASGADKIRQSIWLVLSTAKGERLMLPEFGCGIHDLVFSANTAALRGLVAADVRDALTRWEPRVDVLDVRVEAPDGRPEPADHHDRLPDPREQRRAQPRLPVLPRGGRRAGRWSPCRLTSPTSTTAPSTRSATSCSSASRGTRPSGRTGTPATRAITLIELFAWLAESIGYRLNQAPGALPADLPRRAGHHARAGATGQRPTSPSRCARARRRPIAVPARTVVASNVQTDDGPILFETERGLELMPLRLQSLQVAGLGALERTPSRTIPFRRSGPSAPTPQVGNALYLGFGPGDVPGRRSRRSSPSSSTPSVGQPSPPTDARLQWEYRASADGGPVEPPGDLRGRHPRVHPARLRADRRAAQQRGGGRGSARRSGRCTGCAAGWSAATTRLARRPRSSCSATTPSRRSA